MQTQPRAGENHEQETPQKPSGAAWLPLVKKILNIALAFAGLAIYGLYIVKNWSGYDRIPGGRGLLLALAIVAFVALAATRLYLQFGRKGLLQIPARVWSSDRVRAGFPVAVIVLFALMVRVWGINFGMPYLEQVDEWNVADRAIHIIQTGSFDPLDYHNPALPDNDRQAFTYPTLYTYLQTGVFGLRFLQGVAANQYDGTSGLDSLSVKPDFYLWGRGLTAILGAGTVWLVFLVGRRWYGRQTGLVAALFLAFFYLHVINSRFITTDVPSGFFALLPFLLIFPILEGKEKRWLYFAAGILCGLAVGTKYNNALILLPLLLAHFLGRPRQKWFTWSLPLALFGSALGFFVSSPFIFWHLPNFLTDVAAIINHYQNTGHPGFEGSNNWLYYLQAMAAENLAVVWLGLAGIVIAFARHSRRDVVLLSFPLVSYLQLSSYKVNFTRNLMPVIPFLAIFAGMGLVSIVTFVLGKWRNPLSTRQNAVISILAILAVIVPAVLVVQHAYLNSQPSARARATTWIENNLPRGSKMWIEPFSVELLPREEYRVEGGTSVLEHPPEWYAQNGYNYLVLSEAYHKEARETGKDSVKAAYNALIDGPRPAGIELAQDFPVNNTDKPGARIIILSTKLQSVGKSLEDFKISRPLHADLSGKIRLAGVDLPEQAQAGKPLNLALYWQTLAPPGQNYTVFVHLLDSSGKTVTQVDIPPLGGTRPTSSWQIGEVVRDDYSLNLLPTLTPGDYRVQVGLYLAPNGPNLTLPGGGVAVDLGAVRIAK